MKETIQKAVSVFIVSALALTLTACGNNSTQEDESSAVSSEISVPEKSEEIPIEEPAEPAVESSEEAVLVHSDEQTSGAESEEDSSSEPEESSKAESKVSSEPYDEKKAVAALKKYEAGLKKSGDIDSDIVYNGVWKVKQTKLGDFNYDGKSELLIQYYIGMKADEYNKAVEKQGIAVAVAKYENGKVKEYMVRDGFEKYLRIAGAELSNKSENTEEIYVDDNGELSVLSSVCKINGNSISLDFCTYTLKENGFVSNDGFSIQKVFESGTYGDGKENKNYWYVVTEDNSYDFAINFLEIMPDGTEKRSTPDKVREKFDEVLNTYMIEGFAITEDSEPLNHRSEYYEYTLSEFYSE